MSELTATRNTDRSGRPVVWVLTLLSLLLLGFVTYASIKHNPLYSDRDAYGISKYRFIETCKESLHDADNLTLSFQGQPVKLSELITSSGQLHQGEHVVVKSTGTSSQLVQGVQHVDTGKIGLISPVTIAAASNDGSERVLGQASMQCLHDKATGKTDVSLSVGQ